MKLKILSVMVLMSVGFLGAFLWRVDSFIQSDRQAWFESQSRTQSAAIEQTLLRELRATEKILASNLILTGGLQQEPDWKALAPYFSIVEVNLLNPVSPVVEKFYSQSGSVAAQWDKAYFEGALSGIKSQSLNGVRFYIKPFKDSGKTSWVAVMFVDGKKGIALFAPGEVFQSLIDAQRGGFTNLQLVTELGLSAAHDEPMYIGSLIKDDPIYKKSRLAEGTAGSGVFSSSNEVSYFGSWAKISQTNLKIITKASMDELTGARYRVLLQMGLMGAGILMVFIAVMVWLLNRIQTEFNREIIRTRAAAVAGIKPATSSAPVVVNPVNQDSTTNSQKEKMQVYSRIASSLGHEMRSPLLAILGYSQMIMAKQPQAEVKEATESIIRESKLAKAILDKLFAFAGEGVMEKHPGKIDSAVLRALQSCEPLFARKGVKVSKEIEAAEANMPIHVEQLTKAFENILNNAVEAMDRLPHNKELSVSVKNVAGAVRVLIKDNGEGIDPVNLEKISDPFFTTRSFQNHVGLGLTHSAGVFREHNGEMTIQSELGKGTQVEMNFRPPEAPASLKPEKKVEELPQAMEVPEADVQAFQQKVEEALAKKGQPDLDLDVDQLLEMPANESRQKIEDKTIVLETVNDDKTPALQEQDIIKVLEAQPVDAMPLNDEKTPLNFVDRPDFVIPKKASKLDEIQFEIRRPGSRERGLS